MAFADKIPTHYATAQSMLSIVQDKLNALWQKLDTEETEIARNHSCSCEYCPYEDVDVPEELTDAEQAAIRGEIKELNSVKTEHERTLRALESYAAFMGVPFEVSEVKRG